jgi:hypothetical protein
MPITPPALRVNAVENPSAEYDAAGWSGGVTPSRVTSISGVSIPGGTCLMVPAQTGGDNIFNGPFVALPTNMQGDRHVWVQTQVYVTDAIDADAWLDIELYTWDADNNALDDIYVVNPEGGSGTYDTNLPLSGFVRFGKCVQISAGAASYELYVTVNEKTSGGADGAVIYATQAQVEGGSPDYSVPAYADGNTSGWAWDGTAGESASHQSSITAVTFAGAGSLQVSGAATLVSEVPVRVIASRDLRYRILGTDPVTGNTVTAVDWPASTHTLIGHITLTVGDADLTAIAENMRITTEIPGGFKALTFQCRGGSLPTFGYGTPVRCVMDTGAVLFEGYLKSSPQIDVGEVYWIHVEAVGNVSLLENRADYYGIYKDDDPSQWYSHVAST